MTLRLALLSGFASAAMLAAAADGAQAANLRIAYLAASSQNGFNNAIYQGIQQEAKALGGVDIAIFDGQFDATKQYSQVEDLATSKKFDGIIITPNDTVGIAPALEEATAAGIKVVTTLFPVGPNLDDMQPQVKGLTTTVADDPAAGAKLQADAVAQYCASKNPCNVVVIVGQLIFPFDNLRNKEFQQVLGQHPNIKIVATGEGNYDPAKSEQVMEDILQAHPHVDAVLSNADQHLVGVENALTDAGIDPSTVYLMGGGADQIAIDDIKAGKIKATLAQNPLSTGKAALKDIITTLKGGTAPTWEAPSQLGEAPALVDKAWLDAHPNYKAEWQG
jgi:ribose transport system substrate-binding protein